MRIIKMSIIKIAVLILSCICLTSCNSKKINDVKKEVKKIPVYISNEKKSKITYSKEDTDRIAKYVANGEKAKFIKEMAKNTMKKKGSMKKVNELFSYMDGKDIKTRYVDSTPAKDYPGEYYTYVQCFYQFHNKKNHYYNFFFDFVPVDMNDAGNTGIKGFYIVEIEGWRKGTYSERRIRKPVKLYVRYAGNGTLIEKLVELFDWARS